MENKDTFFHTCLNRVRKGFSLIELMVAITLMGITFFPMMELFTRSLSDVSATGETTTLLSLGREGMEMIRNLDLPSDRLREMESYYYPSLKEEPISMNNKDWRIHTVIHKETRPLRVDIEVIEEPTKEVRLVLTTLFEDLY